MFVRPGSVAPRQGWTTGSAIPYRSLMVNGFSLYHLCLPCLQEPSDMSEPCGRIHGIPVDILYINYIHKIMKPLSKNCKSVRLPVGQKPYTGRFPVGFPKLGTAFQGRQLGKPLGVNGVMFLLNYHFGASGSVFLQARDFSHG